MVKQMQDGGKFYEPIYEKYFKERCEKLGLDSNDRELYYSYAYQDIQNNKKTLDIMTYDEWVEIYVKGTYEEQALKEMQKDINGEFDFLISSDYINIFYDDEDIKNISINIRDNLKKFAIFKRFLKEESIFTNEYDNVSKMFCGLMTYNSIQCEFVLDNLYVHYFSGDTDNEVDKLCNEKIEAEKEYALLNKDKVVFLGIETSGSYPEYKNIVLTKVEILKAYYDEYKDEILKTLYLHWGNLNEKLGDILDIKKLDELGIEYIFSYDFYDGYKKYPTINEYNIRVKGLYLMDSDARVIEQHDLEGLTHKELNLMYNEIFARYGHDFNDKELRKYFGICVWYRPIYKKVVSLNELNDIEKLNVQIIKEAIEKRK